MKNSYMICTNCLWLAFSILNVHANLIGMDKQVYAAEKTVSSRPLTVGPLALCAGHTDFINAICVTPDSKKIVSGSQDRTVRTWDIDTGKELVRCVGHSGPVTAVCVTPDGKKIVSGSQDRTVRIWDINTGAQLAICKGHKNAIRSVCVTLDGKKIFAESEGKNLLLLDIDTGKKLAICTSCNSQDLHHSVCEISHDKIVFLNSDFELALWDISTGKKPGGIIQAQWFQPLADGKIVYFDSLRVFLWDSNTRRSSLLASMIPITPYGPRLVTSDGKKIIGLPSSDDCELWVSDLDGGKLSALCRGHIGKILAIAMCAPDTIVSTSEDKTVRLWDLNTGSELACGYCSESFNNVCVTPDGKIALWGPDFSLHIWVWDVPKKSLLIGPKGVRARKTKSSLREQDPSLVDNSHVQADAWIKSAIGLYIGDDGGSTKGRESVEQLAGDSEKARKLLERVASQTDNEHVQAAAQSILGVMSCAGDGGEIDYTKGRSYFEQAILQDTNKDAQENAIENLEILNQEFPVSGAVEAMKEKLKVFRKLAHDGAGLEYNNKDHKLKLLSAAETDELLKKGNAHYFCNEGKADYREAIGCFEQIVEWSRHVPSIIIAWGRLGDIFYRGDEAHGILQNYARARQYFECAAQQMRNPLIQAIASNRLGNLYYFGHGVEKNTDKACEYHLHAAHQNYDLMAQADSWYMLGEILYFEDCVNACMYLMKAADQVVHPEARFRAALKLGGLYSIGHGIKKDYAKAHMYLQIVADQTQFQELQQKAIERLGVLHKLSPALQKQRARPIDKVLLLLLQADTLTEEKRHKEALIAYEQLAKQDNNREVRAIALATLGTIYFEGLLGMKKEMPRACELFEQAAEQFDQLPATAERSSPQLCGLSAQALKSWSSSWQSLREDTTVDLYPHFKMIEVTNRTKSDLYCAFYQVGLQDARKQNASQLIHLVGLGSVRIPFPPSSKGFDSQLFIATDDTKCFFSKVLDVDDIQRFLRKSFRRTNLFNWYAGGGQFEIHPDVTHPLGLKVSSKNYGITSSNVIEAIGLKMATVRTSEEMREKFEEELRASKPENKAPSKGIPQVLEKGSLTREEQYCKKRLTTIKAAINRLLGEEKVVEDEDVPKIALVFTGGGYRANCETIGYLRGADDSNQGGNIFNCCMYMMGLSGSTWAINPLVVSGLRPADFFNKQRNSMCFSMKELYKNLKDSVNYHKRRFIQERYGQPHGVTGFYGHMLGHTLLKGNKDGEIDQHSITLSDMGQHLLIDQSTYPLPISVAVDLEGHKQHRIWYEFSPFYVGTHQIGTLGEGGSWVDAAYFGSIFGNGILKQAIPEYPLAHYMGIWGSAFALNPADIAVVSKPLGTLFSAIHGVSWAAKRAFNALFQISNSKRNPTGRIIPASKFPNYNYDNVKFNVSDEHKSRHAIGLVDGGIRTLGAERSSEEKEFRHNFASVPALHRQCDVLIMCDCIENPDNDTISEHLVASGLEAEKLGFAFPNVTSGPHVKDLLTRINADMERDGYSLIHEENAPVVIYIKCKPTKEYLEKLKSKTDSMAYAKEGFNPSKAAFAKVTNFEYSVDDFETLAELAEHNFIRSKRAIKKAIECAVNRKRKKNEERKKN